MNLSAMFFVEKIAITLVVFVVFLATIIVLPIRAPRLEPPILAALVTAAVTVFVLFVTTLANARSNNAKIKADIKLAQRKLEYDCLFERWKIEMAFCQDLLFQFYETTAAIQRARSPTTSSSELGGRPTRQDESSKERSRKDQYYPYVQRFEEIRLRINELLSKRPRALAIIGQTGLAPFDKIRDVYIDVSVSVDMLYIQCDQDDLTLQERKSRSFHEAKIWRRKGDEIEKALDVVVEEADRVFGKFMRQAPVLQT